MSRMIRTEDGTRVKPSYYHKGRRTIDGTRANPLTYGSAYTKVNPVAAAAKVAAAKKMGRK